MLNKAYCWHRNTIHNNIFYPGKVLNQISDTRTLLKYFTDQEQITLAKKYFPNGFNPHALYILKNWQMHNPDVMQPIIEIVFELVRQLHFPDAPSRLTSLYACETIEQAKQWQQLFFENFHHDRNEDIEQMANGLWEIEFTTNARLYDASFLDVPPDSIFSYIQHLECAYNYWNGNLSKTPLPELLVPYPVTIKRLICR